MTVNPKKPGDVWTDLRSGIEKKVAGARDDLWAMSPTDLLAEAQAAGLTVSELGGRLLVRGPRYAEEMVSYLLRRKDELLPLIAPGSRGVGVHPIGTAITSPTANLLTKQTTPPLADSRRIFFLRPSGRVEEAPTLDGIPRDATHCCREGDRTWTPIDMTHGGR